MDRLLPKAAEVEETRIRMAYAKRHKDDVRYSWFSPGHLFIMQERERHLLTTLRRYGFAPLATYKILEVGCGLGYGLREFIKWGAQPEHIVGVDLLLDRVTEAKKLCPGIRVRRDNWASVRYAEGLNSSQSSVTLHSTARHDILGQKSAGFQLSFGERYAECAPHCPQDGLLQK